MGDHHDLLQKGEIVKEVIAYEAFGIFGDYDGNAPDTHTICLVSSEELAKEVCAKLNENPRKHNIVFVEGWEFSKRFGYRRELTDNPFSVFNTTQEAFDHITQDSITEDDSESDTAFF